MNSLVSLNWMAVPLNAFHSGTSEQSIRHGCDENLLLSTYQHGTLSQSMGRGWGENLVLNPSHSVTLNQPIGHGWGENILPFEVADELHRAALTRSPLETAPSIVDRALAETMTIPMHEPAYLPPELPPSDTSKRPSFVALQEWEGVVTQVHDQVFTARLMDLTQPNPDEEGEFSTTEISEDDLDLVAPGAIFRWSVGVLKMPGGAKRPISQVVFRRLPQWTKRDVVRADTLANAMVHAFEQMNTPDSNESRSVR